MDHQLTTSAVDAMSRTGRISPRMHAVMDYATAAGFFALAMRFRERNSRASLLAALNGAAVLGLSLFTDYPGGVFRRVSFKTHRTVDAIQAGMAGAAPALMGFGKTPEARAFYTQAAVESAIIRRTDWNAAPRSAM